MIDFLVIGGGMAGTSAAARLSALGSVVLLERETALAQHATGRSAAMFEEHYGLATTVALNRASRDAHARRDVLSPRGLMLVGRPDEAAAFAADRTAMELEPLSPTEAQTMVPILNTEVMTDAAWDPQACDIDVDRLLQSFAKELRGSGGQIVTGEDVLALSRVATGWEVTTGTTVWQAHHVINAAGAWADQVAALAGVVPVGLQPLRRSMGRIPAPGGHDLRRWPMLFGPGERWYAKPDAGALLVSPAEEDPCPPMDAWPEDMVLAEGFARYEAYVTEPVTRLIASWAGLRTFAPDRALVLGPDPAEPSFIWCAGQGGYGIQTAPAASRLIADLVAGRAPELDTATVTNLSPARFLA